MRDLRDVVNGESVCEADGASLAVAVGPMAVGDIGRYRERTRSVWGQGRLRWLREVRRDARSPTPLREASALTADAVFDQVWADRQRSRRRLLVLLGLGFAICLAFVFFNGELRLESLPGSLG